MQITNDDIRRFQEIWREEFQEEITADEAREHIARLDALYLFLYRQRRRRPEQEPVEPEDTKYQ